MLGAFQVGLVETSKGTLHLYMACSLSDEAALARAFVRNDPAFGAKIDAFDRTPVPPIPARPVSARIARAIGIVR